MAQAYQHDTSNDNNLPLMKIIIPRQVEHCDLARQIKEKHVDHIKTKVTK